MARLPINPGDLFTSIILLLNLLCFFLSSLFLLLPSLLQDGIPVADEDELPAIERSIVAVAPDLADMENVKHWVGPLCFSVALFIQRHLCLRVSECPTLTVNCQTRCERVNWCTLQVDGAGWWCGHSIAHPCRRSPWQPCLVLCLTPRIATCHALACCLAHDQMYTNHAGHPYQLQPPKMLLG